MVCVDCKDHVRSIVAIDQTKGTNGNVIGALAVMKLIRVMKAVGLQVRQEQRERPRRLRRLRRLRQRRWPQRSGRTGRQGWQCQEMWGALSSNHFLSQFLTVVARSHLFPRDLVFPKAQILLILHGCAIRSYKGRGGDLARMYTRSSMFFSFSSFSWSPDLIFFVRPRYEIIQIFLDILKLLSTIYIFKSSFIIPAYCREKAVSSLRKGTICRGMHMNEIRYLQNIMESNRK